MLKHLEVHQWSGILRVELERAMKMLGRCFELPEAYMRTTQEILQLRISRVESRGFIAGCDCALCIVELHA